MQAQDFTASNLPGELLDKTRRTQATKAKHTRLNGKAPINRVKDELHLQTTHLKGMDNHK